MNDYRVIFQDRATNYHIAMNEYPKVRIHEFKTLISDVDFSKVKMVLDIPSGGGYLKKYLPTDSTIISADFSEGFVNESISLVSPEKLPFDNNTFDVIFSLSGMHHLENLEVFIEECLRVLKTDGYFIFSDVKKGSNVDIFLNKFVNENNSLGHEGNFFFPEYFDNNTTIKSKIIESEYNEYPFLFENKEEMIHFFKLFFGLDKAGDRLIFEGIKNILGMVETTNGIEVNWGLLKFVLKKE